MKKLNKRIRIGKRVVGFICGRSVCLPILGPMELLPEDPLIKKLTIKQQIDKVIREMEQKHQEQANRCRGAAIRRINETKKAKTRQML